MASFMYRLNGRPAHPWCAVIRRRPSGRQHVRSAPTAVEPDMEVASTSGRPHSSSSMHQGIHIPGRFHPDVCPSPAEPLTLSVGGEASPEPGMRPIHHHHHQQQQQFDSSDSEEGELDEAAQLRSLINGRLKAASTLPSLLEAVRANLHQLDPVNLSHALYRLTLLHNAFFKQLHVAQLTSREAQLAAYNEYVEPALALLGGEIERQVGGFNVWEVSLCLWSLGNLNQANEALLRPLCARGTTLLQDFAAIDCACVLGGLAKLPVRPRCAREFVDHVLHHTLESLHHSVAWRPRELAQVAWSLSRLGVGRTQHKRVLLETLMEMVLVQLEDFTMQELSLIVYSYGRLRYRVPRGLDTIVRRINQHLPLLNSQDAANLMWGFTQLRYKPPVELLDSLPLVVVDRLSEFKPQEVCNLLYGYARLRHCNSHLLECVAKACAPRLHEFSTQDLVLTLWSYGQLEYTPTEPGLFQQACAVLLSRQEGLHPAQITIAMKGFARAGYAPPQGFMGAMAQLSIAKLKVFRPIEFAQLLWSYAALGFRDVALFEAVVAHAVQLLQTWQQPLNKTTVDTVVWCCQRVGFWPQALIDTAEMRGIYVRTNYQRAEGTDSTQAGQPAASMLIPGLPAAPAAAAAAAAAAMLPAALPQVLPVPPPPVPTVTTPLRPPPAIIQLPGQPWQRTAPRQKQQQQGDGVQSPASAVLTGAAEQSQQQQQQLASEDSSSLGLSEQPLVAAAAGGASSGSPEQQQQQSEEEQGEGLTPPHLYHNASILPFEVPPSEVGPVLGRPEVLCNGSQPKEPAPHHR